MTDFCSWVKFVLKLFDMSGGRSNHVLLLLTVHNPYILNLSYIAIDENDIAVLNIVINSQT